MLSVQDLVVTDERHHTAVDHVSFEVRAGEIVGIAGVQGNGQTELVEGLTGLTDPLAHSVDPCIKSSTRRASPTYRRIGSGPG